MIIKYISELLLDHECVIVPELGAFITKDTPAVLDYVNQRLTPPSKEVAFNGQLVTDDGLLIGYVAERQGISTTAAAKMVHDFAMRNLAVIEASNVVRLDGLGVLSRVTERDYVIQLDENIKLSGDAFGLTTIKAQPVYRRETYQQIAIKIAAEQKAKNMEMTVLEEAMEMPHYVNNHNYKWFRAAAYSMMIAFVLLLIGWGANKSDSKFASWNPFFYASPNEFIASHFNNKMEAREFEKVERLPYLTVELPIFKKEIKYLQPIDNELLKPVDQKRYYIIGASFKNEKEAHRCAANFQKQGFSNAMVLPKNDMGNMRVTYDLVMGESNARKQLEIIKKEYNEAAWLLRKK